MLAFSENDFKILGQADEDPCKSCIYCYNSGKEVSQQQSFKYRRELENAFCDRFEMLSKHILVFMKDEFDIDLEYKFEPPSSSGFKIRPFCYAIFSRDYGGGQITAQLNFRVSNDKRSGENERKKQFAVKFSLHDKCSETLRNEDIDNFAENVLNPIFQKRLLKYLQSLHEDFFIYKSLGRLKGIHRMIRAKDIKNVTDLETVFLAKENDEILFQEIFRSYQWDDRKDKEIIEDINKLAMTIIKDFMLLYPFYLFAVVREQDLLDRELNKYDNLLTKKRDFFNYSAIYLLEGPENFMLRKGEPDSRFLDIFREYVSDSTSLEIEEPWVEKPYEKDNLIKLLSLVTNPEMCNVTLKTKNKMQYTLLEELKIKIQGLGFRFVYLFEDIHNRLIKTENWEISLPRGIHMFKRGKALEDTLITYTSSVSQKLRS